MADKWQTKQFVLEGGLILNEDLLAQGTNKPGSLIQAVNFEAGLEGGYKRIAGYQKFDATVVPGTGSVRGVAVFEGKVIAARGSGIYSGSGSGWTLISSDVRTGGGRYRHDSYSWVKPTIVLVNGSDKPAKWDGTTYTVLTNAPLECAHVAEFKNYLFLGKESSLIFSAPADDNNYTPGAGAGEINVGFTIVALKSWRDSLIVFGKRQIKVVTGTSATDWKLEPVTSDLGCVASDTVQEVGGDLVYLSQDGVRTVAATDKIGDLELGTLSKPIQIRTAALIAATSTDNIVSTVIRAKSQYRLLSGRSGVDVAASPGIIGCLRGTMDGNINWEWFDTSGIQGTCAHSGLYGDDEIVVHGGLDGYVYRQEQGNSFDGRIVPAYLQTPYLPFDDPCVRKTMYKLTTYTALTGNVGLSLGLLFDYDGPGVIQPPAISLAGAGLSDSSYDGSSVYDGTSVYDSNPNPVFATNLIGSGMSVSFVFSSYDTSPAYAIRSLAVQYALGGRR